MPKQENSSNLDFNEVEQVNTADLPSTWREASKGWGHSLHKLAPYVGGFPPSLAHYFLTRFSDSGDTVQDPFCGGGTTPLEACLMDRTGWGNDAFIYAYTVAASKCNPMEEDEFEVYLDKKLAEAEDVDNSDMQLLDNDDLKVFYSDYTLDQILRLREVLKGDDSMEATYLNGIMCGILHGPSNMFLSLQTKDTYSGTVDYVREYAEENDLEKPKRDIKRCAMRKQQLSLRDPIPDEFDSWITQTDARDMEFPDESADLILTSPPYLRVLDYTWNNWIRLWWLNADRDKERDGLDLTSSIKKYRRFMRESLQDMYRVLKDDSVAVIVVGDVKKNKAAGKELVVTAKIIAEEAVDNTGFEVDHVINDAYEVDNRSYVVFNQLKYQYDETEKEDKNAMPIDRCLILKKGDPDIDGQDMDINWEAERFTGQKELDQWS